MKPEIKQMWIEALRSGDYRQSEGCLHNEKGYCCLGVLVDLYLKTRDDLEWSLTFDNQFFVRKLNAINGLPTSNSDFVRWLEYISIVKEIELMQLNDIEKKDFNQIADWIEVNL